MEIEKIIIKSKTAILLRIENNRINKQVIKEFQKYETHFIENQ